MDALLLSRIQFAFVISFHVLFPAFTIGLSSWLAFLEFRWLRTRDTLWRDLYFFWLKIFAVSFGMGVVSGIVLSFQLGTNWSRFSAFAGAVLGPLLGYEVLTAFFLEAGFLGVMLFAWSRVPEKLHFLSTCMVALGTLLSTFWILSANSWMHTPQGHEIVDGVVRVVSWRQVIFNPSFPYRLAHMTLAAYLTTCFVIGGVAGWYLRKGLHLQPALRMLRLATLFAIIVVPLQIIAGDLHGLNTLRHQPAKVAAIEAHWRPAAPGQGVPLVLWAIPDEQAGRNRQELAVPELGSLVLTHSRHGQVPALGDYPRSERPPVKPVFYAFRIMVGTGVLMLLLALASAVAWARGRLAGSRLLHRAWNLMLPAGFVAIVAGWFVTEIGRQPYVVQGLLRTSAAVSEVGAGSVAASLAVYVLAYAFVFGFGIAYLYRMLRRGPLPHEPEPRSDGGEHTPARPLSAADASLEEG
ncbi:Cyanide-insensitive ubiquinol oxidase, subunit I [uncultured Stenotrophomonas sp.]|uniref:Cyanide-insensitive ubiquinol oxidase, subunit I n=1 Tax=uncultured Stenotrophomonas sp. TaxID=165438 RepID=A0A1Y5Q5Q0_9GAMM|nr:Cyanide-insensitive ubiquinol oxidase, subunit I [uncultured Stenotrophomonas sp.]